jgi:DNA-binding transcriptional LysR family regulator
MNHRHVTLRQFRYFIAVAESGSVASASRMLNIAQSALTKSLLELEAELGSSLFERSSKGMMLTPQGHRFLLSARKVIGSVADALRLNAADAGSELSGVLSVGVTSLVAGYYLSELFSRFRRNCPAVEVFVTEDTPRFLEHLLINGELDVAIMVSNVLSEPQAMVAETLTRSPNRVWLPANHELTARDELTLADCAAHDQIVLEADRIDDVMKAVWARHQLKPRTILRTSSLEAVRSLVGAGAGIAVLPDFLYRPWTLDAEHVEVRRLRDEVPSIDVGLVWRRGSGLKPATTEFIDLAREQSRLRRG